tara:strand:- start:36 stop:560 length:525 start_codon:yes stop_codon:yes gene_type:complete
MTTRRSDDGEYLARLGLDWRDLSSRSKVPSIKNFELKMLNDMFIPTMVEISRDLEEYFREEYRNKDDTDPIKNEFTENEFASNKLRPVIKKKLRVFKTKIREGSITQGDEYAVALTKYRRITPDLRKVATTVFVEEFGAARVKEGKEPMPNPLEADDLTALIKIAELYRQAIAK